MTDEIKPCPFCGASAIEHLQLVPTCRNGITPPIKIPIHCTNCGAGIVTNFEEYALERWNRRTDQNVSELEAELALKDKTIQVLARDSWKCIEDDVEEIIAEATAKAKED